MRDSRGGCRWRWLRAAPRRSPSCRDTPRASSFVSERLSRAPWCDSTSSAAPASRRAAPLFALEAENEAAARQEAEDRLKRAQAQLENLRKGRRPTEVDAVRAQLAQAQAASDLSATELRRQLDLVSKGFVSRQQLDEARASVERDRARVDELKAQLATAQLAARPDEIRAAQADASAARAALEQAEWRLRQKSVGFDGRRRGDRHALRARRMGRRGPAGGHAPAPRKREGALLRPGAAPRGREGGPGRRASLRRMRRAHTGPSCRGSHRRRSSRRPSSTARTAGRSSSILVEARPSAADAARLKPGQPLDVLLR